MSKELETLLSLRNRLAEKGIKDQFLEELLVIEKSLMTLEIIKECVGLKMSVDEDTGCLYVPITKCLQPLEQNIVIVGFAKGKEKIDLLKEVLL